MRLLIAGWQGQLARALVEIAPSQPDIEALAVGRPALDICEPASIARAMTDFRPDVIINSAAYTAVDKAESERDAAFALNRDGPRMLAEAAGRRGAAIIHVSTDYVFDGSKASPYVEDDPPEPLGVYGRSKLEGEIAVRAANPRHLIVRTAWVHSATGTNFVRTMLRLARERPRLRVVDDQVGTPTYAPHLAEAILALARGMARAPEGDARWGTFHAAGRGEVTWCGLAREALRVSARLGGPAVEVEAITTADYPTAARRPGNSRLDCSRLERVHGLALPDWREGVADGVTRLLGAPGDG
ncbi:MAG: dTDP-4-dehydrorhamnose reductase [Hyphomicrobiaceae bacterium]|nr:dTDP-4-dehydrorhamnose reductase [Hyphomicrobiaceae bacterium]